MHCNALLKNSDPRTAVSANHVNLALCFTLLALGPASGRLDAMHDLLQFLTACIHSVVSHILWKHSSK